MHRLIIGKPQSGKTTICQWWSNALKGKVHRVALNPFRDPGWNSCTEFQSPDPAAVMSYCEQDFRKAVFLEEAGTTLARDKKFDWLTSGSRHRGNGTWLIAQRMQMLSPNLRNNADEIYLFSCARMDAEILSDQYDDDRIMRAAKFGKGEFFLITGFSELKYSRLDWTKRNWAVPAPPPKDKLF